MILFNYSALDSSGAKVEGTIEATDQKHAFELLKQQQIYPTKIQQYKEKVSFSFGTQQVSLEDLEFLTAELSLLLESGVKIDKGIDILRKTKAKPVLASLLKDISASLKQGKSFSESVSEFPDIFDPLYCNLIALGEASGNLNQIFKGLANDLRFRRDLQRKIISSLTYPAVIFAVCILSIFSIFNFIIPKMAGMFEGAKSLPWYTESILSLSHWMVEYQIFLLIGIGVGIMGLIQLFKRPSVKEVWQQISLRLPVLKTSTLMIERIRFNSGLSVMLESGVAIDQSLHLAAGNIKNANIRKEIQIANKKVKAGSALTPALKQTCLYPNFLISLLEVGEETGTLAKVFSEITRRSRQEFEEWTDKMTTLIEPLMILIMGGIVGGVVVTMLLSMVAINDIGI